MTKIEERLKKAHEGALATLEIKIAEIEKKVIKKNIEINKFTIPYLSLFRNIKEYLSDQEIKNLNLRYKNAISKYWDIKKR